MMVHDNHIRVGSTLVHSGNETAVEVRALLTGAGFSAGVEPAPEFGTVGQKTKFRPIARFRQTLPIANLREPIEFLEPFEDRLTLHLLQLGPAQEVRASFHHRYFQIRREMFLNEGYILVEQLLLQRLRRRGYHDSASAADCRNQIGESFSRPGPRLYEQMLLGAERLVQ